METKHTPGPWAWETTPSGEIRLQTPDRGKLYVMGFARKGMRGAQPRFSLWGDGARERRGGIMHDFAEAGGADHPDARLIEAAPELYEACALAEAFISGAEPRLAIDRAEALNDVLPALRAALAKARGMSPNA